MKAPKTISAAHLLLVANDVGFTQKTNYAAEARVACAMHGIPYRLVTFDGTCQTLSTIFRGSGVYRISTTNGEVLLNSFGYHIDEARKAGEIIIADMPSCITDGDNPIMKAFAGSQIHTEFESIGLLVPITTHNHSLKGALEALAAFKAAGIKHDRGLVRAWRGEPSRPTWESFPTFDSLKVHFPIWECSTYMQSMEDMMQGRGDYTEYPALDKLAQKIVEDAQKMNTRERGHLRAAVTHLEKAKDAIYEHLLKPIVEKPAISAVTA